LFDDSVDLRSENLLVEEQKQQAIARIEDAQKRKAAEHEAERQRSTATHQATLAEIGRENLDKHRQLDTDYAQQMAENEAALATARQEWREAIGTAKQTRREKDAAEPGAVEGPGDIVQKARDALAGLGDIGELVQAEAGKLSVRGTFNAAAIEGLGAGEAADRTARATEETAKNTKKMTQQLEQSTGLAFA